MLCGPGLNPGPRVVRVLSLLLVLFVVKQHRILVIEIVSNKYWLNTPLTLRKRHVWKVISKFRSTTLKITPEVQSYKWSNFYLLSIPQEYFCAAIHSTLQERLFGMFCQEIEIVRHYYRKQDLLQKTRITHKSCLLHVHILCHPELKLTRQFFKKMQAWRQSSCNVKSFAFYVVFE